MYYLVSVDHNSMAAHLTRSDGGFKKCCISSVVDGTDNDTLWNGSDEDGVLGVSVRKKKALTEDRDSDTDW
jgi:hypothetical protein